MSYTVYQPNRLFTGVSYCADLPTEENAQKTAEMLNAEPPAPQQGDVNWLREPRASSHGTPPILTPGHQLLPRRRAEWDSNDGKTCRLCRGGTPGEGPAEGEPEPVKVVS